jgi:hypothetical protein
VIHCTSEISQSLSPKIAITSETQTHNAYVTTLTKVGGYYVMMSVDVQQKGRFLIKVGSFEIGEKRDLRRINEELGSAYTSVVQ